MSKKTPQIWTDLKEGWKCPKKTGSFVVLLKKIFKDFQKVCERGVAEFGFSDGGTSQCGRYDSKSIAVCMLSEDLLAKIQI